MYKKIVCCLLCSLALGNCYAQDILKIAFGSCNDEKKSQEFWKPILAQNPTHWYWLGDIVYADTEDMSQLRQLYSHVKEDSNYRELSANTAIDGTWDDHDYGLNDGGQEFPKKDESKIELLRFLDLENNSELNSHKGVYHSSVITTSDNKIKTIFLDTRTFRTELQISTIQGRRYDTINVGSFLGEKQWIWLEEQLHDSTIDLFILASSVQALAIDQGYESWGTMPHERRKLLKLLKDKPAIILSGDRHIAEISMTRNGKYPLYDITSSGLTHTWGTYRYEPNGNRVGGQFALKNFGMLSICKSNDILYVTAELLQIPDATVIERLKIPFPTLK
jgi:alkaline phosphatase D